MTRAVIQTGRATGLPEPRGLSFPLAKPPLNLSGAQEAEVWGTIQCCHSCVLWPGCGEAVNCMQPAPEFSECSPLSQPTPAVPKSSPEIQIQSCLHPLTAPLRKRGKVKHVITGTRSFLSHKHTGSPLGPAGPGHNLRPQTLVEMPFRTGPGLHPS